MKRKYKLLGLIVLIIIGTLAFTQQEAIDCKLKGGDWYGSGGPIMNYCNLPASDAGKKCSDSGQCEGNCLADLEPEVRRKLIDEHIILHNITGACSPYNEVFGCWPFVEDSKVDGILCIL